MRFKVRVPFAVHLEKITETLRGNNTKIKQLSIQSTLAGQETELTEKEARIHLHKLEPVDDAAKAFLDKYHAEMDKARRTRMADSGPSLEERIASSITKALVQLGIIKAPAPK